MKTARHKPEQSRGKGRESRTANPEHPVPGSAEDAQQPNTRQPQDLPPLTWEAIRQRARGALRDLLEKASAGPSSDAYRMLEIMCLNELIEAQLKTREYDAVEVFRARNQAKQLEMRAARVQSQNKLAEAQSEKLRLQIRALEDQIAQIREKALQAREAKKGGKPFDYERALNQISAAIGLRGGEEFLHDEQQTQAS